MNGIKKYQATITNPEYPMSIKASPIRFVNANKHWQVDVGEAMKESEKYPMFVDGTVPFQSRDRNETIYGKSSHRDYVNEYVRYPLLAPVDLLSVPKQPRRPIFPRINYGPSADYIIARDPSFGTDPKYANTFTDLYSGHQGKTGYLWNRITRNF
jgi:hypothetical protein